MKNVLMFFLVTCLASATTYEDAEDGSKLRWLVYDRSPSGATVENIYDSDKGSRVIEFNGDGQNNSYLIGHLYSQVSRAWKDTADQTLNWDMKYSEPYSIYIRIYTNEGYKYMIYTNDDNSKGRISALYVHYGLGSSTIDGTWQTFQRNLEDDLQAHIPSSSIISVEGMMIRGSGRIDNIELNSGGSSSGGTTTIPPSSGGVSPTANAGDDLTTSVGESIQITGTGSDDGTINAFKWEKNGVLLSSSASFSYTPIDAGVETLTLTVTDDEGLTNSDTMLLNVSQGGSSSLDRLNATVYEDAEGQTIYGWNVYDKEPSGATIRNVYDSERGSRVIELDGNGVGNAYQLQTPIGAYLWHEEDKYVIEWSMKTVENYEVYIRVTTSMGPRFLHYTASNTDIGGSDPYIHHGLTSSSNNGSWHTYTRNLREDLQDFLPGATLISVNKFMIRGSGRVDDIKLMNYTVSGNDITPPIIKLQGEPFLTLKKGESYIEDGATAEDNSDNVSSLEAGIVIDSSAINTNVAGRYKVKYTLTDSSGNVAQNVYRTVTVREDRDSIGKRQFFATNRTFGTIFVSPSGSGSECTESQPCNFSQFSADLNDRITIKPGDVVFFREGVYELTLDAVKTFSLTGGTKSLPVTYESYPGERAVFDGSKISTDDNAADDWREGVLQLTGEYAILRNVEIRNMPTYGIRMYGNYNTIEACTIYNNHLSGIEVSNANFSTIDESKGSFNHINDNQIFFNSDAGLDHHNYNKGDNADGITIHTGSGNIVEHNEVYGNSDDGIDTWLSVNTIVSYNKVYANGSADGNGNGIKLGGTVLSSPLGANANAHHNLVYLNTNDGFSINSGKNVRMEYNTAYSNYRYGFSSMSTTILNNNISWKNPTGDVGWDDNAQTEVGNSWQIGGDLDVLEYNPYFQNYLKPRENSDFEDIGAYAQ